MNASPLARGVRTFAAAMTGVLGAAVVADWTADFNASATILALGLIAAALAGLVAFLSAAGGLTATTTLGKAVVTAAQFAATGLATVGLADLTEAAAIDFGKAVLKVAIAAVFAGLATLAVNASEAREV